MLEMKIHQLDFRMRFVNQELNFNEFCFTVNFRINRLLMRQIVQHHLVSREKKFDWLLIKLKTSKLPIDSVSTLSLHILYIASSRVTYPAIRRCDHISRWRYGVFCGRCGRECGGCASLKEMMHPQWKTTASPSGDLVAFPNFGICETTQKARTKPFISFEKTTVLIYWI